MPTSSPRFTVVIPAYNAESTVVATIRSALGQSVQDIEVIVVDDGSTDATAQAAESVQDPRVRVITQKNGGTATARNHGISLASGRYVSFLDSDDLWLPHYLERAGAALDARPDAGFAYTDAWAFESLSGRVFVRSAMAWTRPPVPPPLDRDAFLLELLGRNFIYTSCTVPASVFADIGGYDEGMRLSEDSELWLRIVLRGYPAAWIPGRNGLYRVHEGQKSGDAAGQSWTLFAKFGEIDPATLPSDAHREVLARRLDHLEREWRANTGQGGFDGWRRRIRPRVGALRRRWGLIREFLPAAPPEVAAAYPDLRQI
jgi:glycosyltransferase involved in cell wall biosynthesis